MTREHLRLAADVGIAAALAAAMLVELVLTDGEGAQVTATAVALIVIAVAPVLVRPRHPGWALAGCLVAVLLVESVLEIYQTIPFPSMVAAYSLALVVNRRRIAVLALVLVPGVLVNLAVVSEHPFVNVETVKNLAFVFFPLVLGMAVRDRRDYLAALVERAETAERNNEEEARRRVDEERLRIARDLHDLVAHSLVAINVQAGVAAHVQDPDPETNRQAFRDIKQVSGEALADLRTTLGVLRGSDDAPVAPTPGLDQLADLAGVLRSSGVEVDLDLSAEARLGSGTVGATAYRIVQEALTNVMRHASPTRARVVVRRDGERLVLEVENDPSSSGRAPTPGTGHGLQGMRERAAVVGGSLAAGPTSRGGWLVSAELPLSAEISVPRTKLPEPEASGPVVSNPAEPERLSSESPAGARPSTLDTERATERASERAVR